MKRQFRAVTDDQKEQYLIELLDLWKRVPELRLGQLIENTVPLERLFTIEDGPLLELVRRWVEDRAWPRAYLGTSEIARLKQRGGCGGE